MFIFAIVAFAVLIVRGLCLCWVFILCGLLNDRLLNSVIADVAFDSCSCLTVFVSICSEVDQLVGFCASCVSFLVQMRLDGRFGLLTDVAVIDVFSIQGVSVSGQFTLIMAV